MYSALPLEEAKKKASPACPARTGWLDFLRGLVRVGASQASAWSPATPTKVALGQVLNGVASPRVHFMRNILAHVPKGDKAIVTAALRTIFAEPDRQAAGQQFAEVVGAMRPRWPKAAALLAEAEKDILAYMVFPPAHWLRIYSINLLERLNKEIKRHTYVVGIFPDQPSVIRLVESVLIEIADERQFARRYFPGPSARTGSHESMRKLIDPGLVLVSEPAPFRLAPVH